METEVRELSINGTTYVPKGSESNIEYDGDIKIVILQRGWVMVGKLSKEMGVNVNFTTQA